MNNSLISIIIPTYNSESFVDKALLSCLNQSYKNIEIIVVDDGSKDNTIAVIKNLKDKRIKLTRKENGGVSTARNLGIENANGDYCLFLDSDDWLEATTVKELADQADNNSMVSCSCNYAYDKGNEFVYHYNSYPHISETQKSDYLIENVGINNCGMRSACCKLFSLEIIRKNNIHFAEDIYHIEDGLFVFEYLHHVEKVHYIDKPLWNILRDEASATNSVFNPRKMTAITAIERMMENFENSEKTKIALTNYYLATSRWAIMDAVYSKNKENKKYVNELQKKMSVAMNSSYYKPRSLFDRLTFVFFSITPFTVQYALLNTYHRIRYGS